MYDYIGIGFGPGNIALEIDARERGSSLKRLYLEQRPGPTWQPEMMLSGSDIQNNPIRDLVSLRNPRSEFSFVNYLHSTDQLTRYLNLPSHFPLRKLYGAYVVWAAGHLLESVEFSTSAVGISRISNGYEIATDNGLTYQAKSVVVGTGRTPRIPRIFASVVGERVFHLTKFAHSMQALRDKPLKRMAVVGSSQSAAELTMELTKAFPQAEVHVLMRSYSFTLKDTSPFSEEGYFPDFVEKFYRSTPEVRKRLTTFLNRTNYSSVDADVLDALYMELHEQELDKRLRTKIFGCLEFQDASLTDSGTVRVDTFDTVERSYRSVEYDAVVLATGFRDLGPGEEQELFPKILTGLAGELDLDDQGVIQVSLDYQVALSGERNSGLYLNGLCESTHGIGDAGSFSLLSLRSSTLLNSVEKFLQIGERSELRAGRR